VVENEEEKREFGMLWKRREEQFNILIGIEQEMQEHVEGGLNL
jgi:hypothetical protein